jgi:hypothetical protein
MQKPLFTLLASCLVVPAALACTCPPGTDFWWEQSTNVLLVRIDSVTSNYEQATSRKPCSASERMCTQKQVAKFTLVETFKGSGGKVNSLASGYGGGDCGIPVIAGTFYVVFLQPQETQIGFCNAAGPYTMRYTDRGAYPKRIEAFVSSLRKAAKNPKAVIASRPAPQGF